MEKGRRVWGYPVNAEETDQKRLECREKAPTMQRTGYKSPVSPPACASDTISQVCTYILMDDPKVGLLEKKSVLKAES